MKVYVITRGCKYEGGDVAGVFLREWSANMKFAELIQEKRDYNKRMVEYNKEHPSWLDWSDESTKFTDDTKTYYFLSDFISLRIYECDAPSE